MTNYSFTRLCLLVSIQVIHLTISFGQNKLEPGAISTSGAGEFGITHINDDWICFTRSDARRTLMFSKRLNGEWQLPVEAPFSKKWGNENPSFNRETNKLYFSSDRPKPGEKNAQSRNDIWYVLYENGDWSLPIHLGGEFSTEGIDSGGCEAQGSIYFHSDRAGQGLNSVDIYRASLLDKKPVKVGISTEKIDGEVFLFDQGKKMLFMSGGHGAIGPSDIFVSEHKNGRWQAPISVDETGLINTSNWEYAPSLSPDRSILYFTRYTDQADIYFVEVENLANKEVVKVLKGGA